MEEQYILGQRKECDSQISHVHMKQEFNIQGLGRKRQKQDLQIKAKYIIILPYLINNLKTDYVIIYQIHCICQAALNSLYVLTYLIFTRVFQVKYTLYFCLIDEKTKHREVVRPHIFYVVETGFEPRQYIDSKPVLSAAGNICPRMLSLKVVKQRLKTHLLGMLQKGTQACIIESQTPRQNF